MANTKKEYIDHKRPIKKDADIQVKFGNTRVGTLNWNPKTGVIQVEGQSNGEVLLEGSIWNGDEKLKDVAAVLQGGMGRWDIKLIGAPILDDDGNVISSEGVQFFQDHTTPPVPKEQKVATSGGKNSKWITGKDRK